MTENKSDGEPISTEGKLNLLRDLEAATPTADQQLEILLKELPAEYEVLCKVSQGGMGAIYKAKNRYTDLLYAIKIMRPDSARDQQALQRFIVEAKSAHTLKHPNICQVYTFGLTASKMPYLIMDWVEGISLGRKVARDSRIQTQEALRIFQQVTSALTHAHNGKVVHRDLKPDNIMLSRDAEGRTEVHLVDFGIAKVLTDETQSVSGGLTQTGYVVGTPMYMSPEQANGVKIDQRTDIYALGCVMYFALTGAPPFVGATIIDTINKHLTEPPPEPDPALKIPAGLKQIMFKCIEKDPADRYQSMEEVSSDLKKLSKGVTLHHRPLAGERESARRRRKMAISFLVFTAVGFIIMYFVSVSLQDLTAAHNQLKQPAPPARSKHPLQ